MFSKSVVNTDLFLDMPATTQLLYFHLGMEADDDGFISNPKSLVRFFGGSQDDFKLLITKGYIIPFDSGVIVIRHWKQSNTIRSDRYKPSQCAEKGLIFIDSCMCYQLITERDTNGIPDDNQTVDKRDTQVKLIKDNISKDNIAAPTSNEPEPEATEPIFIELILNTGEMYPVTQKQIEGWKQLYPGVDIEQALRSMAGWLEGNPTKRKTKRGIVRFITSWLDRDQNSGRNQRKEVEDNGKSDYYARIFSDPAHPRPSA